jgi:hypothetical protein
MMFEDGMRRGAATERWKMARSVIGWVLDLVRIFSWDKSFRTNRLIGNYWLNRAGLHVARVVASHVLFRFRLLLLAPLVDRTLRREFLAQGFVRIDSFLPADDFSKLRREAESFRGEIREELEGSTVTQRVYLTRDVLDTLPACRAFARNERLLRLVRYASSKNRIPFFHLENVVHHAIEGGGADPQKDLHSDTFHPCIKAWLYIDDVDARNGPLMMVPRSHRLTWRRLAWEYRQSLLASRPETRDEGDRYWDGSFRASIADLGELGLGPPQPMPAAANTLLIVNVRAMHCRADGVPGACRMTVWMQARDNPFIPMFSPFPHLSARIFEAVWRRYMRARTSRQVSSGAWRIGRDGFLRN